MGPTLQLLDAKLQRLRQLRTQAHDRFDPIWKSGEITRYQAYRWLAKQLGMPFKRCHFSQMSVKQLLRSIQICSDPRNHPEQEAAPAASAECAGKCVAKAKGRARSRRSRKA